jgi:hypothetical protein
MLTNAKIALPLCARPRHRFGRDGRPQTARAADAGSEKTRGLVHPQDSHVGSSRKIT